MDDHTVTGRVLAILDAVSSHQVPVPLAELTRRTGIPKPTVRRIAEDLTARGVLERDTDGYRLGGRIVDLGARAAVQHGLRYAAIPYVQDLFARTGEIAWICALVGDSIALVDHAFGRNRAEELRRGSWPLDHHNAVFASTAAGRVMLAERPDLVDELNARPIAPLTPYTVTPWPMLRAALGVVRDTGVAVEHDQCRIGFSCLAAGIRGTDGSLLGIIGLTGRSGRLPTARLTPALLAASSDIARLMAASRPEHGPGG